MAENENQQEEVVKEDSEAWEKTWGARGVFSRDTTKAQNVLDVGGNIEERDKDGNTPIMRAAKYNNVELFNFLKEKGANLNAKNDKGESLLSIATDNFVKACFYEAEVRSRRGNSSFPDDAANGWDATVIAESLLESGEIDTESKNQALKIFEEATLDANNSDMSTAEALGKYFSNCHKEVSEIDTRGSMRARIKKIKDMQSALEAEKKALEGKLRNNPDRKKKAETLTGVKDHTVRRAVAKALGKGKD